MNKKLLALSCAAVLAACGGGNDNHSEPEPSQPEPTPVARAEGAYAGTFSSSAFANGRVEVVVLENDEVWGIYGTESASGDMTVYGFVRGQGQSSNGSFTATGRDYFYDGGIGNGSITAQYQPGVSISGTIGINGQDGSFSATTANAAPYDYNTPASVSSIAGNWYGISLQGDTVAMSVSSNGSFSGNSDGCSLSGTISPRASGKNVFNMVMNFGGAPCLLPGGRLTGIAIAIPQANGRVQFVAVGTDAAGNFGSGLLAVR